MPFAFDNQPASAGQDITVTCSVFEGDMPLNITWFLNDSPVETYSNINSAKFGKRNLVLSIESVSAEHTGNYSCQASNRAGTVKYTTDLQVYGTS